MSRQGHAMTTPAVTASHPPAAAASCAAKRPSAMPTRRSAAAGDRFDDLAARVSAPEVPSRAAHGDRHRPRAQDLHPRAESFHRGHRPARSQPPSVPRLQPVPCPHPGPERPARAPDDQHPLGLVPSCRHPVSRIPCTAGDLVRDAHRAIRPRPPNHGAHRRRRAPAFRDPLHPAGAPPPVAVPGPGPSSRPPAAGAVHPPSLPPPPARPRTAQRGPEPPAHPGGRPARRVEQDPAAALQQRGDHLRPGRARIRDQQHPAGSSPFPLLRPSRVAAARRPRTRPRPPMHPRPPPGRAAPTAPPPPPCRAAVGRQQPAQGREDRQPSARPAAPPARRSSRSSRGVT